MGHTPFLARLERVAALGRAAREQGKDIEALDAERKAFAASDAGLSRRSILKGVAMAGASATVVGRQVLRPTSQAWATPRPNGQPSIAVIGGGIAGLSAAMTLRDAGLTNVTVYEANTRLGGRTFTRKYDGFFENGQWAEWGGELIDTGHKTIFALAQRFGFDMMDLEQVATSGAEDTLYFNGAYYPWDDMVRDWKASGAEQVIAKQMSTLPWWPFPYTEAWSPQASALGRMTVAEWIDTYLPGGRGSRLGSFIDVAYNIEFGEETSRQSMTNLLGLLGFSTGGGASWWVYGKSDERFKVVGGNQQIVEAQADYVGRDAIALGWQMTAMKRNSNGTATLTFNVGGSTQTVTADRVILAVPLGVLKKLKSSGAFSGAGLDARKLGAIDAMGFGANNKLQLQTTDRFWSKPGPWGNSNGESFADTGYQLAWAASQGQPGATGILNNYTGGDVSRQLNPSKPFSDTNDVNKGVRNYVKGAAQRFLGQVEPVHPGMTSKATGKAMLATWHTNPHSLGAYSYWTPGYNEAFCTSERVANRPFHFAGEHCSQDFQGYIEGGATEGIRAANEVVADFR